MPIELDLRARSSQRCVFRIKRDCAAQGTLFIEITAQTLIAPSDLLENTSSGRVLRVELESALEILGRFSPLALASIDKAGQLKRHRVVRQTLLCQGKFLPSAVVIVITPVQMLGEGEMRFARIWAQASERLDRRVGHGQARWSVISTREVEHIVSMGKLVICERKRGITFDCLIQQANG